MISASFSSAINFQISKSEKLSPLFKVRVVGVVNKKIDTLPNYLGKGKKASISLPKIDVNSNLLKKIIKLINENPKIRDLVENIKKNPRYKEMIIKNRETLRSLLQKILSETKEKIDPKDFTVEGLTPLGCTLLMILLIFLSPLLIPYVIFSFLLMIITNTLTIGVFPTYCATTCPGTISCP